MDISYIIKILPTLIKTLPITLEIFVLASILGIFLAAIVTFLRLKRIPVLHFLLEAYVSFMRSTPGIIHIFLVYYGLPVILRSIGIDIGQVSRFTYSVAALVLYNGAFISEIIRPAYLSIEKTQFEAAKSVGMTNWQLHKRVVFPQILPILVPGMSNTIIELLKDTSLLFLIGLVDIMGQTEIIISNSYGIYQLEAYVAVALIFWVLCATIDFTLGVFEKRVSKYL